MGILTKDQIEESLNYLDEENLDDPESDGLQPDISLIFQPQSNATRETLVAAMPQRFIVDILVSRYFKMISPSRRKLLRLIFD